MAAGSGKTSHRKSALVPLPLMFGYMYYNYHLKWQAHQAVSSYSPCMGQPRVQGIKAEYLWRTGLHLMLHHIRAFTCIISSRMLAS